MLTSPSVAPPVGQAGISLEHYSSPQPPQVPPVLARSAHIETGVDGSTRIRRFVFAGGAAAPETPTPLGDVGDLRGLDRPSHLPGLRPTAAVPRVY